MSDIVLHAPFAGWLSTLGEVADPVFAEQMMGEGLAIDPIEGLLRAPADGVVISVPDSAHAITLRLDNDAELLLHIGLDTVALDGRGFEAKAKAGDRVAQGDVLIAFDLDAVARSARDMVTPLVAPGDGVHVVVDRPGRMVTAGEPVGRIGGVSVAADAVVSDAIERAIAVAAPQGLHARPAARIVALLKPYASTIELILGERRANARSTVALLALGARAGDVLTARADGADAAAALAALAIFSNERFGDPVSEPAAAAPPATGGGIAAAPGLAIGRIFQFRPAPVEVIEAGKGAAEERVALERALVSVAEAPPPPVYGAAAEIVEAHRALLADPQLLADADASIAIGKSAGWAWRTALDRAAEALRVTGDPRLIERIADLRDLERQVLLALGGATAVLPSLAPDTILIADDLLPSQFLALDRERLVGICTAAGGPTAHVVLLAAAASVPMIVAAGAWVLALDDGADAILDADAGTLIVAPASDELAAAGARRVALGEARAAAMRDAHRPATTADGVRIEVFANLGSLDDAVAAMRAGAEGCGLLRTEFLFLHRADAPDESEQHALYARIAATLGERPLIVRTLDIGGDKPVAYLPFPPEVNPALGARGVRLSFARPDLFATQLRAILTGVPGAQCHIMLPMVIDIGELRRARAVLAEAIVTTGRTEPVKLGVMIETPAAALLADQLAAEADFLSIGTNDLTQYTLAADRGNASVAGMVDALHPAVLRLIARVGEAAAQHGKPLGVCGGLASEPRAAPLLIGLGVTELSATPAAVPAVKAAVRAVTLSAALALAGRAVAASSTTEVRAMLGDHA